MTSVGMHKDTGLDIVELDPSDGITLIESGRLPCMVNLNQAFQLAELAKFQKQSEKDCHLVCAKGRDCSEPCGLMLFR